ncbi:MAG: glucose-1-phosphate thymidylyltransferase RfbA [Flavobacteriaceae bacterium]|nr:glucose-1-phosphate thymidylyltransferase RfbA [Flavobacteriaceae bacterium]MCY4217176.1 glucose-1-phosphate thymidylyltransferase RfbA [Flavobacteriaceae bacterium]MCY4254368.1 glucose-1-phosphate thymidylyltransferase RfbA [Flavobacteriaceae bacterium]
MKGIIMAGGNGTRLLPITGGASKQLLPIYDKPMVYYPLSILMLADIRDILIISTPEDMAHYKRLLGDGSQWGLSIDYAIQSKPQGIAQGFLVGKKFLGSSSVCLVLGDNVFYGPHLESHLIKAKINATKHQVATVFGVEVNNPHQYGVLGFNQFHQAVSIEEKPNTPPSNIAVAGLYFYPNSVIQMAAKIPFSKRGELEITTVNQQYLSDNALDVVQLSKSFTWLDTGSPESLLEASQFIHTIEKRKRSKVACLEEIAFKKGWITKSDVLMAAKKMNRTPYGQYLINNYL